MANSNSDADTKSNIISLIPPEHRLPALALLILEAILLVILAAQDSDVIKVISIIGMVLILVVFLIRFFPSHKQKSKEGIMPDLYPIQHTRPFVDHCGYWIEKWFRTINNLTIQYHSLFGMTVDESTKAIDLKGTCYVKDTNNNWLLHSKWSGKPVDIQITKQHEKDDRIFYFFKSTIYENKCTGESELREDWGCGFMMIIAKNKKDGEGWFISKNEATLGELTKFDLYKSANIDETINWEKMLDDHQQYIKMLPKIDGMIT